LARDLHILVEISQVEEIVQDAASVAEVKANNVTQDSDSASEFSRGNLGILVVVETEEDGSEEGIETGSTQSTLDLGDGSAQDWQVTVEEAVVVEDESQIHGDQESELSQIDGVGVAGEISKFESSVKEFSTNLLSNEEVDEAAVGLAELSEAELTVSVHFSLVPELHDDLVLIVLTLDNVGKVLLSNDSTSLGIEEVADVNTKSRCR